MKNPMLMQLSCFFYTTEIIKQFFDLLPRSVNETFEFSVILWFAESCYTKIIYQKINKDPRSFLNKLTPRLNVAFNSVPP